MASGSGSWLTISTATSFRSPRCAATKKAGARGISNSANITPTRRTSISVSISSHERARKTAPSTGLRASLAELVLVQQIEAQLHQPQAVVVVVPEILIEERVEDADPGGV